MGATNQQRDALPCGSERVPNGSNRKSRDTINQPPLVQLALVGSKQCEEAHRLPASMAQRLIDLRKCPQSMPVLVAT